MDQVPVFMGQFVLPVRWMCFQHWLSMTVFLNRRATARYWALASIIPGRERFTWNLSF